MPECTRRLGRLARKRMEKSGGLEDVGGALGSVGSLAMLAPIAAGAGAGYTWNAMTEPGPEEYEDLRRAEQIATLQMLTAQANQRRERLQEKQERQEASI